MYYVPDGTKECGYYECKKCGSRFLSLQTMNTIPCPDCGMDIDYEIGPDETLEATEDTAVLVEKIIGEEEVEKMDSLLSLAITGGDYNWIQNISEDKRDFSYYSGKISFHSPGESVSSRIISSIEMRFNSITQQ